MHQRLLNRSYQDSVFTILDLLQQFIWSQKLASTLGARPQHGRVGIE